MLESLLSKNADKLSLYLKEGDQVLGEYILGIQFSVVSGHLRSYQQNRDISRTLICYATEELSKMASYTNTPLKHEVKFISKASKKKLFHIFRENNYYEDNYPSLNNTSLRRLYLPDYD